MSNPGHLVFIGLCIIHNVLLDSSVVRPRGLSSGIILPKIFLKKNTPVLKRVVKLDKMEIKMECIVCTYPMVDNNILNE